MEKPGLANLARLGPARGPVGRDLLHFARPPHRHGDGHDERGDAAGARDEAARDEDLVGVGVVGEPPPEEGGRLVDRPAEQHEPGMAELRLEGELPSGPLRRRPHEAEDDSTDEKDLAPENLGRVHGDTRSAASREADASADCEASGTRTRWRSNRTDQRCDPHSPSPRFRPRLHSTFPPGAMTPRTSRPSSFSSAGRHGTSWKPSPSSIMANRPEASVTRWR